MMSQRQDRQRKLAQFAAQKGLNLHPMLVKPLDPSHHNSFRTPQDTEIAQEVLRSIQAAKMESEPRKGLSRMLTKSKPSQYKCREIATAMTVAVNDSRAPGVVEVLLGLLLAQNGDVNVIPKSTTVWKKLKKIDQEDRRTDLLPTATKLGSVDTAKLLLPHADQLSMDESLNIALRLSIPNLDVIEILLARGANAGSQHAAFISAVAASNADLVSLLINASKSVAVGSMTEALWNAVKAGCLEMVFLLGMSDADADDGSGKSLKSAVQSNELDIAIALTLCKRPPSSKALDEALWLIFSDDSTTSSQKLKFVDLLLTSGADGDCSAAALIHVTNLCTSSPAIDLALIEMVNLLVKFNRSLDFNDSEALKIAIQSSRLELIEIFLNSSKFNADLATVAFTAINQAADRELQLSIASRLLDKGAQGTPLHEALLYAVKTDHTAAVEMLVLRTESNKASVDYKDAAALKDAVSREKLDLVRMLLSGGPTKASVSKAFPCVWDCERESRFVLATALLYHKARGVTVNRALVTAVADHSLSRDGRFIKLLVNSGADVNFENGKAIDISTKDFDMAVLDTLLAGKGLDPKSLSPAFVSAIALRPIANRYIACKKLIAAGAAGDEIDQALTVAVTEIANDTSFLKLLAPKANVDYDGGRALSLAIENCLPQHLVLLLAMGPTDETFDNAFTTALNHTESSERMKYCRMLLESSPAGSSVSSALLKAVQAGNIELCDLFLEFKASANFLGGAAVVAAVRAPNIDILTSLVQKSDPALSEQSMTAAFEATLTVNNEPIKFEMAKLILEAGLRGKPLDVALASEVRGGDNNLPFCSLLLLHKARVNYQAGEALNIATRNGALSLLEKLLAGKRASEASLSRSFGTSQSLSPRTRPAAMELIFKAGLRTIRTQEMIDKTLLAIVQSRPVDKTSLNILLENGASIHFRGHLALKHAAESSDNETLELLLKHVQQSAATSIVFDWFEDKLAVDGFWKTQRGLKTLELLLRNNAEGEAVNKALVLAVTDHRTERFADPFLAILLQWNVDINYNAGQALQVAARQGNKQVLSRLFAKGANATSCLMAFPYLFTSGANEQAMLSLVELFVEYAESIGHNIARPFDHPGMPDAIVFLSVRQYPKTHSVLKAVLDAGFSVDQKMHHEYDGKPEKMTCLFWALSLPPDTVSESVVETLINYRASLNGHPQPLLHLAITKGFPRIVQLLIKEGAEVDLLSAQGISPLSLAFQKRDIISMEALLAADAETNDGTLHDAARCLDSKAIDLLMNHDHDPNSPSLRHGGRGALAELCYRAPSYAQNCTANEVKKSIKALLRGNARTDIQTITDDDRERSLLYFALDSTKPYLMVKAFLECGQYDHVHDLYTDGRYTYSAIMYVEKGLWEGQDQNRQSVLNLLKTYQCRRRYWKHKGPQPPDMEGAPSEIQQAEDQRQKELAIAEKQRQADLAEQQRRQLEQRERMRLKEEEAQAALAITQREHNINQKLAQERHQTEFGALQARLGADLAYQKSRANIENERNAKELATFRAKEERKVKTISDIKAIEQRNIQEERKLVESRTALGQKTIEVAKLEMDFRRQNGGQGSSLAALGDVSGRANRYIQN